MKVQLEIVESYEPGLVGKVFGFEEADTFIFGRSDDCHCVIAGDPFVSRHHFLLEIHPPHVHLKDLGSRNGTMVGERKYGGEQTGQGGGAKAMTVVPLRDGDRLKVGKTVFRLSVKEDRILCSQCGDAIESSGPKGAVQVDGKYMCTRCLHKPARVPGPAPSESPVVCRHCGKDMSSRVRPARRHEEHVCEECRVKARDDSGGIVGELFAKALKNIQGLAGGAGAGGAFQILDYDIDRKLGAGGMGAVYLARHKKTGELAAVKVTLPMMADDEHAQKVFNREIRVTMEMHHPNIVRFIDRGHTGSLFYFILEYLPGGDVLKLMEKRGGRLAPQEAVPIARQALAGLAHAHAKGFVHRDLKPPNILLSGSSGSMVAKVSDFGLAKSFLTAGMSDITNRGAAAGSLPWMPKEQLTNFKFLKPVSDIFSMGATLYTMLTGDIVYEFERGNEEQAILQDRIVPILTRNPDIPARLAEVVGKSLAVKTKNRYQDAAEMMKALGKVLD